MVVLVVWWCRPLAPVEMLLLVVVVVVVRGPFSAARQSDGCRRCDSRRTAETATQARQRGAVAWLGSLPDPVDVALENNRGPWPCVCLRSCWLHHQLQWRWQRYSSSCCSCWRGEGHVAVGGLDQHHHQPCCHNTP